MAFLVNVYFVNCELCLKLKPARLLYVVCCCSQECYCMLRVVALWSVVCCCSPECYYKLWVVSLSEVLLYVAGRCSLQYYSMLRVDALWSVIWMERKVFTAPVRV